MSDNAQISDLFSAVREVQEVEISQRADHDRHRTRALLALQQTRHVRGCTRRRVRALPLVAAAALLLCMSSGWSFWTKVENNASLSELTFVANGAQGKAEAFLSSPRGKKLHLKFSDGSAVVFTPESAGRVEELSARGAQLRLERGAARVEVVHRKETRWTVQAGPYAIQVLGTKFDVSWDASSHSFHLDLEEGTVRVSGPSGSEHLLVAGQSLWLGADGFVEKHPVASSMVGTQEERLSDGDFESKSSEGRTDNNAAESTSGQLSAERVSPSSSKSVHESLWSQIERSRRVDPDRIVEEKILAHQSAQELMSVARALRRRGDARESRVLSIIRLHHPDSLEAVESGFLLGRRLQDSGQLSAALPLLEGYLRQTEGSGEWSEEVRGRLIGLYMGLGGRDMARKAAREYLEVHLGGPYTSVATEITAE